MQKVAVGALVAPTDGVISLMGDRTVVLADPGSVDALWSAVAPDVTHLVLVGERRHEAAIRRNSALVADRGVAVSWILLPHGPAAVVVLAVEAASSGIDAGLVPLFVRGLAARTWSGAWTPTVARLEDPVPSLGQHLRSWMPSRAGYLVTLSGTAEVLRVGRVPSRPADRARSALLCAGEGLPAPALTDALLLAGATEQLVLPGLCVDPLGRFGSARAVEMLALPADEGVPVPSADGLPRCSVCDAVVPAEFCSYCHVRPATTSPEKSGVQR